MANVVRQDVIQISIDTDLGVLKKLTSGLDELKSSMGALGKSDGLSKASDEVKKLGNEANKAKDSVKGLGETKTDKTNNELKKTKDNLGGVEKAAKSAHSGLKKLASVSLKALTAGITAAGAGLGVVIKNAVSAYGDYEQLIGGVETLFKDDSNTIVKYANDAYKTAGLSANQYMDTVTGFSASLLQSLGGDTKKAAEYGNLAVTDMADNANKMGTGIESIQFAYQGFAKQNYTMLDNLKLGYGGTKEEMQRLVKDAAKIDKSIDSNSLSYANVVKAIHAVQENMGITGTTAKEASTTIQGSFSSLKSAWGNLMTSLVTGGDSFDQCVENLISSAMTFKDNIMPALEKALSGIGTFVEKMAPILEREFPKLVETLLPPLIKAATSLVMGLVKSLPQIIGILIKEIPNILKQLGQAIVEALTGNEKLGAVGGFVAKLSSFILGLVGAFLAFKKIQPFISSFTGLFGNLFGGKGVEKSKTKGSIFDSLAKLKPTTILKAFANLSIIIGGMTVLATAFALVAPLISKLSDTQSLVKMIGLIGALGVVGAGLSKLASIVGKIPISTVAKGLANIAIVISGMSALFLLIGALSALNFDLNQLMYITKIIAGLSLVGGILAGFAGIIGLIPIPIVLAGLANIALVLGGMSAIIVAFGALSRIKGFNEFITSGGEILSNLFGQIGKIAGSLVSGLGEGLSNSLPKIGENLAAFGESLKPLFAAIQGADIAGLSQFFKAIGSFMLQMTGEAFASIFTGGVDLAGLGAKLTAFANNASGFFTMVATLPANSFENAKLLFNSLAGINSLPKEGGITQWFTGKVNFTSLANGLGQLSSEKVMGFFNAVANIPQAAFNQTKLLFDALAEVRGLPKQGGVFQWFTGDSLTALGTLTEKMPAFGKSMAAFYSAISEIKDFDKISQLFDALGNIDKKIGKKGGALNWAKEKVSGSKETGLSALGDALRKFGEDTKSFFDQVNSIDIGNLNSLWDSLKKPGEISTDTLKIVEQNISDIVDKVTKLPQQMADGIKSSGGSLKEALVSIWEEAAKAMANPVNKIIEGANWILKEFGSDKKIASWTPYAKGTDGHKGGNALVNDGNGAELVQMPNGNTFVPQGKNVLIPNAPKGMKVLPADQTAQLLGKKHPTFRYSEGTGDIDIWSYMDDPKGLIDKVDKKFVNYDGLSGFALNAGKAMVSTITGQMADWSKKLFDEFGAKSIADYVASGGVEQWKSTVAQALKMEGQYSESNVKRTLFQMQTESGGNPKAINLWDSNAKKGTPSKGLMQVIDPTFKSYARPGFNSNIYDPLSNILASVRYAVSRYGSLGKAYRGVGYANGGIVNKPTWGVFGEDGDEALIPLSKSKRKQGLGLWSKAGEMLGAYSPESSAPSNKSVNSETNNYSPSFSITINGTDDTKGMERKIKKWISESMDELFDSMARKARV